jgi:hypothetical protein
VVANGERYLQFKETSRGGMIWYSLLSLKNGCRSSFPYFTCEQIRRFSTPEQEQEE